MERAEAGKEGKAEGMLGKEMHGTQKDRAMVSSNKHATDVAILGTA